MRSARVAGVIVAGGAGRRMGGVDKAALPVGGVTLLDRVLAAAYPLSDRLVVVGRERDTRIAGVSFVVEAEPGGGPAPAVLAGLAAAPDCDTALVLATDLPLLTAAALRRLLSALQAPGVEAAAATGRQGPNPLLAAYGAASLRQRTAGIGPGRPARDLLPPSTVTVDLGPASLNVNRPEDLAAAEVLVAHQPAVVAAALWLRGLVTATVPDCVESVDERRHGFAFRHGRAGPFCAVVLRAAGCTLAFAQGARLPDPRGLLRGAGRGARHVEIRAPGDPPGAHLAELVEAAVGLDGDGS